MTRTPDQAPPQPAEPQATQPAEPQATQPAEPQATQPAEPQATQPAEPRTTQLADQPDTRQLRADARQNRARLITAATEAFAEKGADAPLEDVARRAGVGIGTLYRHFPPGSTCRRPSSAARW